MLYTGTDENPSFFRVEMMENFLCGIYDNSRLVTGFSKSYVPSLRKHHFKLDLFRNEE